MGEQSYNRELQEKIIAALIREPPNQEEQILFIGHTQPFIEAVVQYYNKNNLTKPTGLAVEFNEERIDQIREKYQGEKIQIHSLDFLSADLGGYKYIIGAPPQIPWKQISDIWDIDTLRHEFIAGRGKFDISFLYLEQALEHLSDSGRLVMILPSRFASAENSRALRKHVVTEYHVEYLEYYTPDNDTDSSHSQTQLIVSIANKAPGETRTPAGRFQLPNDGGTWSRTIHGIEPPVESSIQLDDICSQIRVGVATGADDVFIMKSDEIPPQFDEEWLYPVIGGKQLSAYDEVQSDLKIICPYTPEGRLAGKDELDQHIVQWFELNRAVLEQRNGINIQRDPWYAWIQPPAMRELLRPKIFVRDFSSEMKFWLDVEGSYIPRRTVFYIIPEDYVETKDLVEYLSTHQVRDWLEATSHKMKNGVNRIGVRDLREIPVPEKYSK